MRLDGHEILIVQVPFTAEAVMVEGNGFPYRAGKQVVREPQEIINQRKEAYRRVGCEQRIRQDAALADLELAARFLSGTVYRDRGAEELLVRFGLVLQRAGPPAVTNAALLLFGKTPIVRWHPRSGIRLFRVAGTERAHGSQRNVTQLARIDAPIATAIGSAHALAKEHIRRSEKLHDLFFREMPEYPEFAWQEALINAIAHRDYEDQAREIEIWFYDDRMEVKSPGDLVPPVTLDQLRQRTSVHASRNPLIVRLLVEAGLMREEGEGIARMFEEMETSYLNAPEFAVEASTLTVTLRNEPIFAGVDPAWYAAVRKLPLSLPQRRLLVAHPATFTNEDLRKLSGLDRDEAYQEIQDLVGMGFVSSPPSAGRGAIYRVLRAEVERAALGNATNAIAKPAIPIAHSEAATAWVAERVRALTTYLLDHETLTNADYRAFFLLERDPALRELKQLSRVGWLVAEGSGRGSRYRRGPLFLSTEGAP